MKLLEWIDRKMVAEFSPGQQVYTAREAKSRGGGYYSVHPTRSRRGFWAYNERASGKSRCKSFATEKEAQEHCEKWERDLRNAG